MKNHDKAIIESYDLVETDTELVPGIIDEEQRTDETLNIRDYM